MGGTSLYTFIEEFHREANRQRAERDGRRDRTAREQTEREIRRVIEAIKAGVPGAAVKDEMASLETRRIQLLEQLDARTAAPPPMPRLHPNLAELYRQKIINLAEALNDEHTRLEAAACIRDLIEEIRLVPENGKLRVELYGRARSPYQPCKPTPPLQGSGPRSH
jgi:site-specific DNA recombinase